MSELKSGSQASLTERMADWLDIQGREAQYEATHNPSDYYMRGMYNGMLLICCSADGIDYTPMPTPKVEPQAVREPTHAMKLVESQVNDEALWFVARTATEVYLQNALRRLHEAVEAK